MALSLSLVCWLLAMNNDTKLPAVQLSHDQSVESELMRDASVSCCEDAEVDWRLHALMLGGASGSLSLSLSLSQVRILGVSGVGSGHWSGGG